MEGRVPRFFFPATGSQLEAMGVEPLPMLGSGAVGSPSSAGFVSAPLFGRRKRLKRRQEASCIFPSRNSLPWKVVLLFWGPV